MTANLRTYETICLTKVDMPVDKLSALITKIKGSITDEGKGEVLMEDDWGKAKIAYPIAKEPRAQWNYFRFRSTPAAVDSIKHQLRINEFVLRELTCRCDAEGTDYNALRANFPKELNDRFNIRDDRPRRRRERGGPGGRGDGPRGDKRSFRDDDRDDRDDRDERGSDRGERYSARSEGRGSEGGKPSQGDE